MTVTWASECHKFKLQMGRKVYVLLGDSLETVIYILVYTNFIIAFYKVTQNAAVVCV